MRTLATVQTKCEVCGKLEDTAKSRASGRRFCSWSCRDIGGTKPKTIIECGNCGKSFSAPPHRKDQKYCSNACRFEGDKTVGRGLSSQDEDGYIVVYWPSHPRSNKNGYIREHRIVAEEKYGRPLTRGEHVHHLNGIRNDNRPENLVVMAARDHMVLTRKEENSMRAELAEYRRLYGPLKTHLKN